MLPLEVVAGKWEHLRKRSSAFVPLWQLYLYVIDIAAVGIVLKFVFTDARQSYLAKGIEKDVLAPSIFEDC